MRKHIFAISALIYVNLLPYLSRLPYGMEWVKQYLPDDGIFSLGMYFFHTFYSVPAVILVLSIYSSKKYAIPFLSTFLVLTTITLFLNHDYDLASDAQAAIGLIFIPMIEAFFAALALGLGYGIQHLIFTKTQKAVS